MEGYISKMIVFILIGTAASIYSQIETSIAGPKNETIHTAEYSNIYYVDKTFSDDVKSDGSKSKPWNKISDALNNLNDQRAESRAAIFIAAASYGEVTLIMKEYVDFYGGFNPQTWERDIHSYLTILDGQNSRRVVMGVNNGKLDGFVIANGLSQSHGGGILCEDSSPTISNCIIINNSTLEPEEFNHDRIHQEGHHGGGIACLYNSVPIIRNNLFLNNRTSIGNGAGIAFFGWIRMEGIPQTEIVNNFMTGGIRPLVKNNVFMNNIAGIRDTNRTRSSNGGAISIAYESRPVIDNNIIASNQALGRGDAGGIYCEYFSYPTISSNWIIGNVSDDDGGGIYTMKMGHAIIENNFIAGNATLGGGVGGIRISKEGRANISKNIFVYNLTGGAVDCVDGYMELRDNIIMHNKGKSCIRYSNHFHYFTPSIIEGNIIASNESGVIIETFGGKTPFINNNKIDIELEGKNIKVDKTDFQISRTIRIKKIVWDKKLFQLKINIDSSLDRSNIGRVVRVNDFWSVISNIEKNEVYIWGKEEIQKTLPVELEILSDYKF